MLLLQFVSCHLLVSSICYLFGSSITKSFRQQTFPKRSISLAFFSNQHTCANNFFAHKVILGPHRYRLTANNFKACVQLKVTNYKYCTCMCCM